MSEEYARLETLAAVGSLAAGVAHDINNALTYVTGNAELALLVLEDDLEGGALPAEIAARWREQAALLRRTVEGLHHIAEITRSLREAARPAGGAGGLSDAGVVMAAVQTLASPRAAEREVTLDMSVPPGTRVGMPAGALTQVLLNLVLNAIDASPRGAPVRVDLLPTEDAPRLRVADRGCGLPPGVRERLFEPFITTKPTGTGLGLYVCHKTLADHGGAISVRTGASGTEFVLRLPPADRGAGA